jgi:hypothetical protein
MGIRSAVESLKRVVCISGKKTIGKGKMGREDMGKRGKAS